MPPETMEMPRLTEASVPARSPQDPKTLPKRRNVGDGTPGPGRPKGVPNKATREFKAALMECFDGLGGVEALQKWAADNPTEFYRIMARTLPIEARAEIRTPGGLPLGQLNVTVAQFLEARREVLDGI